MNELQFTEKAKQMVADYSNKINIIDEYKVKPEEVYVVWSCKTLQNNKALLSTDVPDGRYYEVTYNGDKQEFYFDAYIKEHNQLIK
ncbi:DUF6275 family protein [Lactococcus petauri]|uniref:DUF6275 family protein n=1 Tax=Lactococcus TaxID=1357 RepID=UPI0015D4B017|nr:MULTISPECIES: DUF6275 family protein [Lactococcus]MDG6137589.1 DUF6275 family protein [Lactococcus petauri]GFO80068.1 hypothetical protein LL1119B1_21240 [Lactococcus lactis]